MASYWIETAQMYVLGKGIGPAGQQTYRALVIINPSATTTTTTTTILPNSCH